MASPAPNRPAFRSVDEFLAWEGEQDEKWQLIDGELVMMTGGSIKHGSISAATLSHLRNRLRGTGCLVLGSDVAVKVDNGNVFYPDVSVICEPETQPFITAPVVIVEVLSPSTERVDRGLKLHRYLSLPSLQHYVLLSQEAMIADVFDRVADVWTLRILKGPESTLTLSALKISVPLADLYEDADLPAAGQG